MRSMFDDADRGEMIRRLRALRPDASRRWGKMTAPRMIAHLIDQMSHTLGDAKVAPMRVFFRGPATRFLSIYVLPWPHGRISGPAEAFVTAPGDWAGDLARLETQLARFAAESPARAWPDHPRFGPMSGRDWGCFCYRHFDHHLRQFGG